MKWEIGFIKNNKQILTEEPLELDTNININFENNYIDKNFGIADPFIYKNHIFCEAINMNYKDTKINGGVNKLGQRKTNKHKGGIIVAGKLINNIDKKEIVFNNIISNKNFHLSYPHIYFIIISKYMWINVLLGYTQNLIGGSRELWIYKHMVRHHV